MARVTSFLSRRSRAWSRREGNSTWSVMRSPRRVAVRALSGLLVALYLTWPGISVALIWSGKASPIEGGVWASELKIEVRTIRVEGSAGLEEMSAMMTGLLGPRSECGFGLASTISCANKTPCATGILSSACSSWLTPHIRLYSRAQQNRQDLFPKANPFQL